MFFSKKSLEEIEKKFNLEISNLTYSFHTINIAYDHMKKSKSIFQGWTKKNKLNKKLLIKFLIKSILPKKFLKLIRKLRSTDMPSYENFINGDENSWCLRVLYRNIDNNQR